MPIFARAGACSSFLLLLATAIATAQPGQHVTRMEVVHGKPYVMVMVNGKGPFRFVVDTGTGGEALIAPSLADQLHLPAVGESRLVDPSGQGNQKAPILQVQSLNVAGVEFTDVRAIRHQLASEDGSCQGLLGFVLFRDYLLRLDYPERRLALSRGGIKPDGEKSVLPFRMPDGVPIVTIQVAGKDVDAQIDTGGIGLSLPAELASRLKFVSDPALFAISESLATRFKVKAGKLAADVNMGRYTFDDPVVEINPAFPLANLGGYVMQFFAVTFDQNNGLVRLDARKKVFHLNSLPSVLRLQNAPPAKPVDQSLVPVG
ncbi:MAG TPA: pepsin/retropepsin-like aspartic protease family protein [Terracidiphilus sp.]|nr:pepsin/retropepsin-like aspartic protease family protein [Terracidiphilus sp.]